MDLFDFDTVTPSPDAAPDYDLLTFEERDERDAEYTDRLREALTGLPSRPGTKR